MANKTKAYMNKLYAIREVGRHLFMWGVPKVLLSRKAKNITNEALFYLFINYLRTDIPIYSKYACGLLLDYYLPEWRKIAGFQALGAMVSRDSTEINQWKKIIIKRDGKCLMCGNKKKLEAHHIIPWSESPDLRTNIENGMTVCIDCHAKLHPRQGKLIKSRK